MFFSNLLLGTGQYFIKNWSEAMEEISRESFLENITTRLQTGSDEEEEEGYRDE